MVAQQASCCGGKGKNMRKTSRFISILSLLVLVLVMLPGVCVRAGSPGVNSKNEKQYVTLNEKESNRLIKALLSMERLISCRMCHTKLLAKIR